MYPFMLNKIATLVRWVAKEIPFCADDDAQVDRVIGRMWIRPDVVLLTRSPRAFICAVEEELQQDRRSPACP